MSEAYPKELRYSPTHEWVRIEDNQTVTVGITDHAQHLLGDLVFVELPKLHQQTVMEKRSRWWNPSKLPRMFTVR